MERDVALVLSSGGARGYAHIGAIEELEARGYRITSVAGTSMGALIGGVYAAGGMEQVKQWMLETDRARLLRMTDFSLSVSHIVKGERIINALLELLPDQRIESMPIPFCAIATDLQHGREVVFDRGSLYAAIRASIAIPTYFSPLRTRTMLLVDGGITNPLPLNRVSRKQGDLLVAVNVSAPPDEELDRRRQRVRELRRKALPSLLRRVLPDDEYTPANYYTILSQTIQTQIQRHTILSLRLTPPDVLCTIPANRFVGWDAYEQAKRIIRVGRLTMRRALDEYEQGL
ncbi:MAG: patatin-like phospholipase family protein [Alloprevotella sp.]|nr:patatin-like phospholipase family protein [Alloprevotella sp.]